MKKIAFVILFASLFVFNSCERNDFSSLDGKWQYYVDSDHYCRCIMGGRGGVMRAYVKDTDIHQHLIMLIYGYEYDEISGTIDLYLLDAVYNYSQPEDWPFSNHETMHFDQEDKTIHWKNYILKQVKFF